MSSKSENESEVVSPTMARAKLADLIRRAKSGEDVLIGARGVAEVRMTRRLRENPEPPEPGEFDLDKHTFSVMMHGLALSQAWELASRQQQGAPLSNMPSNPAGDVFEWLLDHPNPWWAQDFVITMLLQLRDLQSRYGLPLSTLDKVLSGLALTMRGDYSEMNDKLSGEFRTSVARMVTYMCKQNDAVDILRTD